MSFTRVSALIQINMAPNKYNLKIRYNFHLLLALKNFYPIS